MRHLKNTKGIAEICVSDEINHALQGLNKLWLVFLLHKLLYCTTHGYCSWLTVEMSLDSMIGHHYCITIALYHNNYR